MKRKVSRWMAASVYTRFKTKLELEALKVFLEGERRDTSKVSKWVEVRFDGPYYRQKDRSSWIARIEVNLLVACALSSNIYEIFDITGLIAKNFTHNFPCYKYGNKSEDDKSFFGTMKIQESNRDYLKISHFGQIDPKVAQVQAVVEAAYEMEFTWKEPICAN